MRIHRATRLVIPALVAAAALGCAATTTAPRAAPTASTSATAPAPALAAYVLLVESPEHRAVPFARVIVAGGQACPELLGGREAIAMSKRGNPHGFTVDVCEAEVPFEQALSVATGG